ncbi:energy-coupling factor ABC transporter permease [Thiomicrorhabdus sp.]|uniref:energy-coupling factor ABC transporter permease n=1 Tax=Thiomicrorhabdus sp. TaxID=2039724 RepID=UPI002AA783DD|nr:energy-coupling factor ABC transporter permease [Thiomicrorhabdus sp.]
MNLIADSLGLGTLVGGWVLFVLILIWALKTAPWHKVDGDRGAQHVLLGMAVIVFFIWQVGASIDNGITFHFLLMTLMTMMFGPQFAILAMLLALIGVVFESDLGWLALGINAVLMGVVPIMVSWFMYRIGAKFLEPNFFVYLFYNGFLSAAVGIVISLGLSTLVMLVNDVHTMSVLKQSFIVYIPLMATPEGFVNGMLLAAMILLKPQWVATFHDSNYINGK